MFLRFLQAVKVVFSQDIGYDTTTWGRKRQLAMTIVERYAELRSREAKRAAQLSLEEKKEWARQLSLGKDQSDPSSS